MHSRLCWILPGLLLLCGAPPLLALPAKIVPAAPDMLRVLGVGMAPLRAIAEICGAGITGVGTVHIVTLGKHAFMCTEGDVKAWQDGKFITLPQAPITINGRCYVPVRPFVRALGGSLKMPPLRQSLEITLPHTPPFTVTMLPGTWPPSQLAEEYHVFLVATDGSRVHQLSYFLSEWQFTSVIDPPLPTFDPPSFTADGSSLLYESDCDIKLRRLNSPTATVLADAFVTGIMNLKPRLGKDGFIYFMQQQVTGESAHLCRMHIDGSGIESHGEGAYPLFSADGSLIAYTSTTNHSKPEVHIMHADGSKDRILATGFANGFCLVDL